MKAKSNPHCAVFKTYYADIAGTRLGVEYSRVAHTGRPYLSRFILYCFGTLRLHKFWRGDDDRAPHDHPWWFITFPLTSYTERIFDPVHPDAPAYEEASEGIGSVRIVKAWRFHYRPAKFRHFVIGRADGQQKPFWTFAITGPRTRMWGFWPFPKFFVPWREWT